MDKYCGGCISKDWARSVYWESTDLSMVTEEHPVLVLASREGEDIALLNRRGFDRRHIIAVDNDKKALAACRALRGEDAAQYYLGNVDDVVRELGLHPSVAFLDFCGTQSPAILRACYEIAERVVHDGFFGVVFSLGHELPSWRVELGKLEQYVSANIRFANKVFGDYHPDLRKRCRRLLESKHDSGKPRFPGLRLERTRKLGDELLCFYPHAALQETDWEHSIMAVNWNESHEQLQLLEDPIRATMARVVYFDSSLNVFMNMRDRSMRRVISLQYTGKRGSPMMCVSFRVEDRVTSAVKNNEARQETGLPRLTKAMVCPFSQLDQVRKSYIEFFQMALQDGVQHSLDPWLRIAEDMHITKQELAAWKAVATKKHQQDPKAKISEDGLGLLLLSPECIRWAGMSPHSITPGFARKVGVDVAYASECTDKNMDHWGTKA